MRLFLVYEETSTLMKGTYTTVIAVCMDMNKAEAILKDYYNFDKAVQIGNKSNYKYWKYVVDVELIYYFIIQEIETGVDLTNL